MTSSRLTKYQRTHSPRSVIENKCDGRDLNDLGMCAKCGRWTPQADAKGRFTQDHRPNETGSLGWVAHYGDGSTRSIAPGEAFSR